MCEKKKINLLIISNYWYIVYLTQMLFFYLLNNDHLRKYNLSMNKNQMSIIHIDTDKYVRFNTCLNVFKCIYNIKLCNYGVLCTSVSQWYLIDTFSNSDW